MTRCSIFFCIMLVTCAAWTADAFGAERDNRMMGVTSRPPNSWIGKEFRAKELRTLAPKCSAERKRPHGIGWKVVAFFSFRFRLTDRELSHDRRPRS